jgi:hypothetical protein
VKIVTINSVLKNMEETTNKDRYAANPFTSVPGKGRENIRKSVDGRLGCDYRTRKEYLLCQERRKTAVFPVV